MLTTTGSDLGADAPRPIRWSTCARTRSSTAAAWPPRSRARWRLHHSAQEGPIFWGAPARMAELRRQLDVLARSPLPVLIEGETGTGKSFLAEHVIHPRSGAKGPLVVTDLSTIPPPLLAAHLFGARRGAYTGAVEDHAGVFEQAHGGTLFLDEIANLDLELQRQLLLVLERGAVTRLGDTRPRAGDAEAGRRDQRGRRGAGAARGVSAPISTCASTRRRGCACRRCASAATTCPTWCASRSSRRCAPSRCGRWCASTWPASRRPRTSTRRRERVVFGRPRAEAARRDAFSVFVSREALARLAAHDWPGNHRELKLLAANALVFCLTRHLDAAETRRQRRQRARRPPCSTSPTR